MKRYCFDITKNEFVYKDWLPEYTNNFGPSCVKKNKYVSDKVRINNQEVATGSNRTALYTMPGGVDNGVRYAALYEHSGLDITEIEANKKVLEAAKSKVEDMVNDELEKAVSKTADKVKQTVSSTYSSGDSE